MRTGTLGHVPALVRHATHDNAALMQRGSFPSTKRLRYGETRWPHRASPIFWVFGAMVRSPDLPDYKKLEINY